MTDAITRQAATLLHVSNFFANDAARPTVNLNAYLPRGPGEPFYMHVFPNQADPGHQTFSNWQFTIFAPELAACVRDGTLLPTEGGLAFSTREGGALCPACQFLWISSFYEFCGLQADATKSVRSASLACAIRKPWNGTWH